MRNDPVDMGKLIKALEVSMIHDLPITLVPKEAKKLRGELLAWERMVGILLAEREKYRLIPVEERLPKFDNDIDIKHYQVYLNPSFGCRYDVWLYLGDGYWLCEGADQTRNDAVTHWMPLPEPPESNDL